MTKTILVMAFLFGACAVEPPPPDEVLVSRAADGDQEALDALIAAGNSKYCVVRDNECTCPEPDAGMKVKRKICEPRVLGCGRQGFCTYVRDTAVPADDDQSIE